MNQASHTYGKVIAEIKCFKNTCKIKKHIGSFVGPILYNSLLSDVEFDEACNCCGVV